MSYNGLGMDPAKVKDVLGWEAPWTRRQLQVFVGFMKSNFLADVLSCLLQYESQGRKLWTLYSCRLSWGGQWLVTCSQAGNHAPAPNYPWVEKIKVTLEKEREAALHETVPQEQWLLIQKWKTIHS